MIRQMIHYPTSTTVSPLTLSVITSPRHRREEKIRAATARQAILYSQAVQAYAHAGTLTLRRRPVLETVKQTLEHWRDQLGERAWQLPRGLTQISERRFSWLPLDLELELVRLHAIERVV